MKKIKGRIPLAGKTRVDEKNTTRLAKSEKSKTKKKKKKER